MLNNLSRTMLKRAYENMKSLLNQEGEPVSLTDKIPLAIELENIKKKQEQDKLSGRSGK